MLEAGMKAPEFALPDQNWGWLLISFLAAMLLWKWLSVNPTTARSFPFAPEVLASLGTMIERGVLWQDFSSSNGIVRDSLLRRKFCS